MISAAEDHDLAFARSLASPPSCPMIRARTSLIEVGIGDAGDPGQERQGTYFTVVAPHEEAVAATVTGLQEHVLEYTHGDPLPPCPGHRHPLQASVVDGVASSVCPTNPAHHVEPILPGDTVDPSPSGRAS